MGGENCRQGFVRLGGSRHSDERDKHHRSPTHRLPPGCSSSYYDLPYQDHDVAEQAVAIIS